MASFLGMPVFTNAQIFGSTLANVEISLSPEYPQPGQIVIATVSSPSENVRNASIVWLLNNKIKQQKAGGTSFTFVAGKLGVPQNIGVLVKTLSGKALVKSLTIKPSQVTLLWEANTYTPPFYKGRALYSSGSLIRAEAIPNFVNRAGKKYDPSKLLYKWSKNGTVLGSLSGISANSIITNGPKFLGNYILSVEVSTQDKTQVARSAILVKTANPIIALYKNDPLTGVQYNNSIAPNQTISETSQLEIQAIPYFMSVSNVNDNVLNYSWYVNNTKVSSVQNLPSLLSIQLSTTKSVATNIQVVVEHALHLLQTGRNNFNITFSGNTGNSLFGL